MNNYKVSSILFIVITYSLGITGCFLLFSGKEIPINFILFNILYYIYTNISFTVGWHRYFVHKAFKTSQTVEWLLFLGGAAIFIGSLSEWIQDHQNHHKNLNTDQDPTNINEGFFYSHIGWALVERNKVILENNKLLNYWHNYYLIFAIFSGLVFPVLISSVLSSDLWLSICISFGLRVMLSQNIIGLLGSYCHKANKEHSIDSHLVSLLCFGEGYQKYHHEFPGDYRNGPKKTDLDFSKWVIFILNKLGLIYELRKRSR